MQDEKKFMSFINDTTGMVTYVSLVIIYLNIIINANAINTLTGKLSSGGYPLKVLGISALLSPIFALAIAVWEYFKLSYRVILKDNISKNGADFLWNAMYFGFFIGNFTFLFVMSWFVAFQSNEILSKASPILTKAFNDLIN